MTAASVFPGFCSAVDGNFFFLSTLLMIAFFGEEKKISLCAVRTNSYFMQYCNTVSLYSNVPRGFNGLQSLNNTFSALTARIVPFDNRERWVIMQCSFYVYFWNGSETTDYFRVCMSQHQTTWSFPWNFSWFVYSKICLAILIVLYSRV
jgi:hypothetical protein